MHLIRLLASRPAFVLLVLLSHVLLTGQTSCGDEGVHIIARTDSSIEQSILTRQDGIATSARLQNVAKNFGTVAYNTEPQKHIFLFPGNISQGLSPNFRIRLPAGNGVDGDGRAFSISAYDPDRLIESIRVYDSGICSSRVTELNPALFALAFPFLFAEGLNEDDGIKNAEVIAWSIKPVFKSNNETFLSSPLDYYSVRMTWDARKIEGSLRPDGNFDPIECNGARVRTNFDLLFSVENGEVSARIENIYVHVSQQPDWDAPLGSKRCSRIAKNGIKDALKDKIPQSISEKITDIIKKASRVPVNLFSNINPKHCTNDSQCKWIGGAYSGTCDQSTNTCSHVFVGVDVINIRPDAFEIVWMLNENDPDYTLLVDQGAPACDPSRLHVESVVRENASYTGTPYTKNASLLH